MPLDTSTSAVARTFASSSVGWQSNAFHPFQPMGGVAARSPSGIAALQSSTPRGTSSGASTTGGATSTSEASRAGVVSEGREPSKMDESQPTRRHDIAKARQRRSRTIRSRLPRVGFERSLGLLSETTARVALQVLRGEALGAVVASRGGRLDREGERLFLQIAVWVLAAVLGEEARHAGHVARAARLHAF